MSRTKLSRDVVRHSLDLTSAKDFPPSSGGFTAKNFFAYSKQLGAYFTQTDTSRIRPAEPLGNPCGLPARLGAWVTDPNFIGRPLIVSVCHPRYKCKSNSKRRAQLLSMAIELALSLSKGPTAPGQRDRCVSN